MIHALHKNAILYITLFVLLVFIFLLFFLFSQNTTPPNNEPDPLIAPTAIPVSPQAKAPAIGDLPRIGRAINTDASVVLESEKELEKVRAQLPYLTDFTATTGKKVEIVIPSVRYQDDPWKLTVNIFGPEYGVSATTPQYEQEKRTFLEGANEIFRWIKSTGADPDKVIIKWGDKAYIQERAEEWLKQS